MTHRRLFQSFQLHLILQRPPRKCSKSRGKTSRIYLHKLQVKHHMIQANYKSMQGSMRWAVAAFWVSSSLRRKVTWARLVQEKQTRAGLEVMYQKGAKNFAKQGCCLWCKGWNCRILTWLHIQPQRLRCLTSIRWLRRLEEQGFRWYPAPRSHLWWQKSF